MLEPRRTPLQLGGKAEFLHQHLLCSCWCSSTLRIQDASMCCSVNWATCWMPSGVQHLCRGVSLQAWRQMRQTVKIVIIPFWSYNKGGWNTWYMCYYTVANSILLLFYIFNSGCALVCQACIVTLCLNFKTHSETSQTTTHNSKLTEFSQRSLMETQTLKKRSD